jgi:hypothetical protein
MKRANDTDELINLVRGSHDPSKADFERVLAGMPAKLVSPQLSLVVTPLPELEVVATKAALPVSLKLVSIVAVAGLVALGAVVLRSEKSERSRPVAAVVEPRAPAPVQQQLFDHPQPPPASKPKKKASSTLEQELGVLEAARRFIRDGDQPRAIVIFTNYLSRFPNGAFREEASARRVLAMCELRDKNAAAHAAKFQRDFSQSFFLSSIERCLSDRDSK